MNCKSVRSNLDAFVDGELANETMSAIRRHFDGCICCSQEFQSLSLLKKELAAMSTPQADPDFEDRLLNHVFTVAAQRPAKVRRRFQLASFAAAVAAALTLATIQSLAVQQRADAVAQEKRLELDRDRAYLAAEDPLSGGSFMMPASYGR